MTYSCHAPIVLALLLGACAPVPPASPPPRAASVTPTVTVAPLPPRPVEGCSTAVQQAIAAGRRRADEPPQRIARRMPNLLPEDGLGRAVDSFVLQFEVDAMGRVDTATVRVDKRIVAPFPAALRRAATDWRYRPAVLNSCPVPYVVVDTMGFAPLIGR